MIRCFSGVRYARHAGKTAITAANGIWQGLRMSWLKRRASILTFYGRAF